MKEIYLYNTLTKDKDKLVPIDKKKVSIYSCGPTLYSTPHIGNMRCYVFADILQRTLTELNYKTKYVINLTDVGHLTDDADDGDDKIEKKAREERTSAVKVVKEFEEIFFNYLEKMNIPRRQFTFPKATEHIEDQIDLIRRLEERGYAYKLEDGIYFDTSLLKNYGRLGNFGSSDSFDRARIKPNTSKRNRADFALWKLSKDTKRQQEWDSPWGVGFPGWHLECSSIAEKLLGKKIDIHTGGIDHISIHHNNELAQIEAITNENLANIWMHVAFVNLNDEKISKSLKNTYTITELEEMGFNPLSLRYLFLLNHYRTPLAFSINSIQAAEVGYMRLKNEVSNLKKGFFSKTNEKTMKQFYSVMSDDLNTAKALSILREMLKDDSILDRVKYRTAKEIDKILGLKLTEKIKKGVVLDDEVSDIVKKLKLARERKDYKESDKLREKLKSLNYEVSYIDKEVKLNKKL